MSKDFSAAIKDRRTYYTISNQSNISDSQIQTLVEEAVQYTPSAFHSQSARTVLLLGEHHLNLWDIVRETLRKLVPEDKFQPTDEKINAFAAGYGSILYFEDTDVVKELQEKFQSYKDNFPIWAQQSNGMLQLVIWTSLENEGFGASLQHYNPIIDEEVKKQWDIPGSWQLIAQMPFGVPTGEPNGKTFLPIGERTKVFQ